MLQNISLGAYYSFFLEKPRNITTHAARMVEIPTEYTTGFILNSLEPFARFVEVTYVQIFNII